MGFSPFELLFGRRPKGPVDFLADSWLQAENADEAKDVYEHVFELRNIIHEMGELAHDTEELSRDEQKKYRDRKCKRRTFEVGDEVLVFLGSSTKKLLREWKGPFKIVALLDFDYIVDMCGRKKVFHANMLKKFHRRESGSVGLSTVEGECVPFPDIVGPDLCPQESQSVDGLVGETRFQSPEIAMVAVLSTEGEESSLCPLPVRVLETKSQVEGVSQINYDPELSQDRREQLENVFAEFSDILTSNPGECKLDVVHHIRLTADKPVFRRQYPLPFTSREVIKTEVKNMLDLGVIEPSKSPYSAPVVLVPKPDGSVRFCIDYRELNKVTITDAEPIPDQEELFSRLSKSKFFTKIDLAKGYWQLTVAPEDREKTAFQTPEGLFQWVRMPFGLVSAPSSFARAMRALKLGQEAENFFDDILIHSETWEDHLVHVEGVLQKLRDAGLTARPSKVFAGYKELEFLGHMVGMGIQRPQDRKVEKILNLTVPTTKRQVRALIGLASYYRRYIRDFASKTAAISNLLSGKAPRQIKWTSECDEGLQYIKSCLSKAPVLLLADMDKPFVVRTDASSVGIGGVLLQDCEGVEHPVAYVSRKLLPQETRYSTIERECLAIVWVLSKFARYLWGREFVLQTDHKPLLYLRSGRFRNARIMRWALSLQEFQFSVESVKGTDNGFADALSRVGDEQYLPY